MFAARVRASLKPLFRGRHSSSLSRSCEIAASLRRVLHDRFNNDGESANGVGSKLINRGFRSISPQCYSSESDVGVKTLTSALFSSLEDHFFSELGSVEKERNSNMVVELLTKMPEPFQVEKSELSQETKRRKTKKKKKHGQASDSTPKLKLLTEKPEASWKTNGKSKAETHASARNVTDSFSKPTELSSPVPDHESKAQSIISPCPEEENETTSNGSSTSDTPSNHPSPVLVIRNGNLNSNTTDSEIHSRCLLIGSLKGFARVDEDSVDVLFRARNMHEAN